MGEDIILHGKFIADDEVKNYFSVADFVVLPYRTASQSGVTQIAYNFSTPMIVTGVGGLPEIVPHDRVGLVCEANAESIATSIETAWSGDNLKKYIENMPKERQRFSWAEMCTKILEVYKMTN